MLADSPFDKRAKVPLKGRCFLIAQSLRDCRTDCRHQWIAGAGQEALPGLGVHPRLDVSAQLQVHFVEARHRHKPEKVSLIEVDHGVVHRVLDAVVERIEPGSDVGNGRDVVTAEGPAMARDDEPIDRLEKCKSPARSKDSAALPKARRLLLHVDQNRADRDHIDRRLVDFRKIIRRAEDKPASVPQTCLSRVVPAQAEQISGEVVEDSPSRRTRTFEGTETNQPVTCPEVQDDISFLDMRSIEQAVSNRGQEGGKQLTTERIVPTVAMPDDPLTPRVTGSFIHHSEYRTLPVAAGESPLERRGDRSAWATDEDALCLDGYRMLRTSTAAPDTLKTVPVQFRTPLIGASYLIGSSKNTDIPM